MEDGELELRGEGQEAQADKPQTSVASSPRVF